MNPKDHALFKRYPLHGTAQLSTGEAPMPYHIYRGYGLFIGGTASLQAARDLLKDEAVNLAQNADGQAMMGVWVCDFTEASLGPHHELQLSIFVSPTNNVPIAPISSHPLGLSAAMLTQPDLQMLCHGLWNNTPNVVAYNRELLSLNARLTRSHIERDISQIKFGFDDAATDTPIFSGHINNPARLSLRANLGMMAQVGFGKLMRAAQQPWLKMNIINPRGVVLNRNAIAEAFAKNDATVMRYFDPAKNSIDIAHRAYRLLGFKPQFVQYMDGFKFVYLNPM